MTDVAAGEAGAVGPDLSTSDLSKNERLEQLRRQIAAIPARGEAPVSRAMPQSPVSRAMPQAQAASLQVRQRPDSSSSHRDVLPVPGPLAALLPRGGLARGSVVEVAGATSLLLGLLASVTESGGHVAVVGQPKLGLLAAVEMGAKLERLALIPDPGPDPVEIAAVLLDGMDLVVVGLAGLSVSPSRARAVTARARSKGAALVVTDGRWDGAEVRLAAQVGHYRGVCPLGVDRSIGRLNAYQLTVQARGRSFQSRSTRCDVQYVQGRVEWVAEKSPMRVVGL